MANMKASGLGGGMSMYNRDDMDEMSGMMGGGGGDPYGDEDGDAYGDMPKSPGGGGMEF